jgi:hypothetical protein
MLLPSSFVNAEVADSRLSTMMHPKLLDGLNYESKGENIKRKRSWNTLPGLQHFKGRRACWVSEMGLGQ